MMAVWRRSRVRRNLVDLVALVDLNGLMGGVEDDGSAGIGGVGADLVSSWG
jgi:hypothetical protein